jgi:hypothetical protein
MPQARVKRKLAVALGCADDFGNSFQNMDLLNSDIPTLEEYGQWVSKQMYYFGPSTERVMTEAGKNGSHPF